jgi:hypothetical protein
VIFAPIPIILGLVFTTVPVPPSRALAFPLSPFVFLFTSALAAVSASIGGGGDTGSSGSTGKHSHEKQDGETYSYHNTGS